MAEEHERLDGWLRLFAGWAAEDSRETAKAFHQTMIALCGGAILVSVGFVERLVPSGKVAHHIWLLFAGWSLFVASLLCILVAFLLMLRDHYKRGQGIGAALATFVLEPEQPAGEVLRRFAWFKSSKLPTHLSWCSIAGFVIGVGCVVGFVAVNIV
jgi:hypothetical protein